MSTDLAPGKALRGPLNGVDTPTLFATIDAVRGNPEIAKFQFRARNRWVSGTHNRSVIRGFYGAGQEDTSRTEDFVYDADHPAVLVGSGNGPTPVEFLLHALAACLTSGLANIAAARGVQLTEVESTVEGDIDLLGVLGLSEQVRNGYQGIRVSLSISGDAPEEVLRGLVEQSRARSAVYDVFTNGVPVEIDVTTR
ncbi:OsmC family protein [Microbispora sp. ZYX-F-249]|uniref:OsmC family protein n=1 Tax=Microbispora maris TaxID=3144104 RepID=A0ABV0AZX2_9ACTN